MSLSPNDMEIESGKDFGAPLLPPFKVVQPFSHKLSRSSVEDKAIIIDCSSYLTGSVAYYGFIWITLDYAFFYGVKSNTNSHLSIFRQEKRLEIARPNYRSMMAINIVKCLGPSNTQRELICIYCTDSVSLYIEKFLFHDSQSICYYLIIYGA